MSGGSKVTRDVSTGMRTGKFTVVDNLSTTVNTAPQTGAEQTEQEAVLTQSERAALNDVNVRTQQRSERYDEAGLGEKVRSGEISGAEAEREVRKKRDPNAPKKPSQVQRLELKLEAKTAEDHGARSSKRVRGAPC